MFNILHTINNGILVIDKNLIVLAWNEWLEIKTKVMQEDIIGKKLSDFFPEVLDSNINRKVKLTLNLKSDVFMTASIEKYLLKIPQNKMTKSLYDNMQQDVIFSYYDENSISIVLYDQTQLLEAKQKITLQATTDQLTGAFNRFKLTEVLDLELSRSKRYTKPLSLVILDIDFFKKVNDNHGHLVGDSVLIDLSRIIANLIRDPDLFARWGGEEFILLLPETSLDDAFLLSERVRLAIESHKFDIVGNITCSFGVAGFTAEDNQDSFLRRADDALYQAKESGRNKCVKI